MEEQEHFNISTHTLVPTHTKINEEEKQHLLTMYNIGPKQLPLIHHNDPAITKLECQEGDIIKITRTSPTTGTTTFYRRVVHG
ncbi:MAG TPA: DNA-directed RNA polymerase subunit H [Candidatus Nanoarchaeia archaeon]|nr:DNA-directed RNA polymerase subunit H [Candidatus Nanoarchaeia archaeon]